MVLQWWPIRTLVWVRVWRRGHLNTQTSASQPRQHFSVRWYTNLQVTSTQNLSGSSGQTSSANTITPHSPRFPSEARRAQVNRLTSPPEVPHINGPLVASHLVARWRLGHHRPNGPLISKLSVQLWPLGTDEERGDCFGAATFNLFYSMFVFNYSITIKPGRMEPKSDFCRSLFLFWWSQTAMCSQHLAKQLCIKLEHHLLRCGLNHRLTWESPV